MPQQLQAFVAVVSEKSCGVESSLRNRISERRRPSSIMVQMQMNSDELHPGTV